MAFQEAHNGSLAGFSGAEVMPTHDLLLLDVDVLVPAAVEDVITVQNAKDIKAKLIVEGANGPTSAKADKILNDFCPDSTLTYGF